MKRILIYGWLLILPYLWILTGCADEDLMEKSWVGKDEVWINLPFGCSDNDKVNITTRATYDLKYESMVQNVYVFIFANNERVYGQYFDQSTLNANDNLTGDAEKWYVSNMQGTGNTKGKIRMKVPVVSNAEIFMIANLDLNFLSLSEERLNMVRNKGDLEQIVVSLNQDIVERNAGLFMMTGNKTGVQVANNGTITVPGGNVTLQRLDAKVEVNVKVDQSGTIGLDGQRYVVKEFVPDSWEVYNLPDNCFLVEKSTGDSEKEDKSKGYFNLPARKFETYTDAEGNGFSFYMMENRESDSKQQSTGNKYHLRDMRTKNADGTYASSGNPWAYAPEFGTYLVLKGTLNMEVNPNSTAPQQLTADVMYHIHLGDFRTSKDAERNAGASADNYDINRNTHYTYTVKIKGVNSIETEVQTSNAHLAEIDEPQPGASGNIYKTKEESYVFDAHYGQRVYTLNVKDIVAAAEASTLSWYVKTPFGREGSPSIDSNSGQPVYEGLDYKWVEFMLNEKNPTSGNSGFYTYSDNNQWYPGENDIALMDVIQFTNLLKQEAPKYRDGVPNEVFDKNGDLKVTVFVNEYYYEKHPIDPSLSSPTLWKEFVNKPHRIMHILSNPQFSKDGESSVTNSSITIRQRAIETPYNMKKVGLQTAWGCETVDEMNNEAWFYHPDERMGQLNENHKLNNGDNDRSNDYTPENTSRSDGLYNTACLLNMVNNKKWNSTALLWSTFLDNSGHELKLKGRYKAGLYSVFLRNRDLDGDREVDANELRWYIASLDQLCGLFLGDQGMSSDAQLYPLATSSEPNTMINGGVFNGVFPWRLHVVSSTAWGQTAGNLPTIVWAEEGASIGEYQQHYGKGAYSPIRCVRNLGMDAATEENIKTENANYPNDKLVQFTPPASPNMNSVYQFDFTNINEASRRYYTTQELLPGTEYSIMSRLFDGFETGSFQNMGFNYDYEGSNDNNNNGLKTRLENRKSPSPSGYRVPNMREGVVMYLYCDKKWWNGNYIMVSSYYSFGYYGNRYDARYNNWGQLTRSFSSWTIGSDKITVDMPIGNIRFVKDWTPTP